MKSRKNKSPSEARHRIQWLRVDLLEPTPDSRRKPLSKRSLQSLARSIKRHGLLQPIVARPHPDKKGVWEIRAGERRWRAAQLAGFECVPVITRPLDDAAALSVTITENLQREPLGPLEEAGTIQQALDRGEDAQAVASTLGKSPQFVARRAALTRLTPAWQKAYANPHSPVSRLSPAHLELVARLPQPTQDLLAENDFSVVLSRGYPRVEDLRRLIDGELHTLQAMPWPPDDDTLEPQAGACTSCPKRSGCQPLLFDPAEGEGQAGKSDRCLDPACYDRKHVAYLTRCEGELRQKHVGLRLVQLGYNPPSASVEAAFGDRLERIYSARVTTARAERAVPVMQVEGPKAGQLVYLDIGEPKDAQSHALQRERSSSAGQPLSLDERKQRLSDRRDALCVKSVEERLRKLTLADLAQRAAEGNVTLPDVLALLIGFGTTGAVDIEAGPDSWDPWDRYDAVRSKSHPEQTAIGLLAVTQVWARQLVIRDKRRIPLQANEAERMCRLLGLDFDAIRAEAVSALPEPKSWATLAPSRAQADSAATPAKPARSARVGSPGAGRRSRYHRPRSGRARTARRRARAS